MNFISFIVLFILTTVSNISLSDDNTPKKTLTIYTHELFVADWMHVGNPIKKAFENDCKCNIEFVTFNNSSSILSRLILEGDASKADIVLGISSYIMDKAENSNLFAKINFKPNNLKLPIKWENEYFLPLEYSYLTLVYNSKKFTYKVPTSFEELISSDQPYKLIIQDPRTSSTGVALILWLKKIYGDKAIEKWKGLKKKVHLISRTWGESYNLFTYGEGDMVFTNHTSPVYHYLVDNNYDYEAVNFKEGHILEINIVGKLKNSKNPELAEKLIEYLFSKSFQKRIPANDFMLPVVDIGSYMPTEFDNLIKPKISFFVDSDELRKNREKWIKEWLVAMLSRG